MLLCVCVCAKNMTNFFSFFSLQLGSSSLLSSSSSSSRWFVYGNFFLSILWSVSLLILWKKRKFQILNWWWWWCINRRIKQNFPFFYAKKIFFGLKMNKLYEVYEIYGRPFLKLSEEKKKQQQQQTHHSLYMEESSNEINPIFSQ